jgi:uncharacterized Zn-binding protein involved in type VI secretion
MPVTVKVNGVANSLVHKGSNHISMATLPDVCKTPSPGGPVPIPYPNISQSITLAKGTTSVKADGMMIAIKGSEFSLSNGDNAGVAGGVKSSTFMKESTWILYSFDVKMNGKNACRLTDKKFQNHENAADLTGTIGPLTPIPPSPPCPQCGGQHPGLTPGDSVPDETPLRRGIPADKVKPDGSISKSAFKDPQMSVDMAARRTPADTLAAPHLAGGKTVEFTAKDAREAFPGNDVVFDCVPGNSAHCTVKGKKTDGQCNQFAKKVQPTLT